jgi:hypothetical protein
MCVCGAGGGGGGRGTGERERERVLAPPLPAPALPTNQPTRQPTRHHTPPAALSPTACPAPPRRRPCGSPAVLPRPRAPQRRAPPQVCARLHRVARPVCPQPGAQCGARGGRAEAARCPRGGLVPCAQLKRPAHVKQTRAVHRDVCRTACARAVSAVCGVLAHARAATRWPSNTRVTRPSHRRQVIVKKGEKELPGLTDEEKPRLRGPKRVTKVCVCVCVCACVCVHSELHCVCACACVVCACRVQSGRGQGTLKPLTPHLHLAHAPRSPHTDPQAVQPHQGRRRAQVRQDVRPHDGEGEAARAWTRPVPVTSAERVARSVGCGVGGHAGCSCTLAC